MSILSKLFGGGAAKEADTRQEHRSDPQDYNGFQIVATPYKEAGQYQLCGVITKTIDGATREHRFIRADRFAGLDDAVAMTFLKARQIIDQQGDRMFGDA